MAKATKSPGSELSPGKNPGQDEFDKLVDSHFSPGDERMMEERAKAGANEDKAKEAPTPDELSEKEQAATTSDEQRPKTAEPDNSLYNTNPSEPERAFFKTIFNTRRRKLVGGGAAGTIIAMAIFLGTFLSGPFEFVHFAQLVTQFHFTSIQDQENDRFAKEVRFAQDAKNGKIENTRMSRLGNRLANTFEAKLNSSGLVSAYSDKFGLFNGYVLDTETEGSPFHGLSEEDQIAKAQELYGATPVKGETIRGNSSKIAGKLVISGSGLSYRDSLKLNTAVLQQAGYNKLSAAIGARIMCKRAGCTFHPLTKLANGGKAAIEDWFSNRNKGIKNGETALNGKDTGPPPDKNDPEPRDASNKAAAADAINGVSADATAASQDAAKISALKTSLTGKLTGGVAQTVGVLCMVKGVNKNAADLKQTQVVLPLIRMGTELIAVGSQIESGQDVDLGELGQLSKSLNGVDASGKKSSWIDAESIQAELGHAKTGVAPSGALTSIGKGVPFDFVNKVPGLGGACGAIGQVVTGVISIALNASGIGAVANVAFGVGINEALAPFVDQLSHWLAGDAANTSAVGADYGNNVNYGAKLGANEQFIAAGGTALNTTQANQLNSINDYAANQQFQQKNIVAKLFDPNDPRSAISKVIDSSSPSFSQNIASITSGFLHVSHSFASAMQLFSRPAVAAPAPYDYGFATYGFSEQDMDSTVAQASPYANASDVETLLSNNTKSPNGKTYVEEAKNCFNITLAQVTNSDSTMSWDATSGDGALKYSDIPDYCSAGSDANLLKVRFFIMDTEVMNSMACYAGDDTDSDIAQACSDVGFDDSSATTTTTTPPTTVAGATIDMANLYNDSTSIACAPGTKDLGTQDGYTNDTKVEIRICGIPGFKQDNNSLSDFGVSGTDGNIAVNSRVSGAVLAMFNTAKQTGITFTALSSFRTMAYQQSLCPCDGVNIGRPGESNHQMGLAIDFEVGGVCPVSPDGGVTCSAPGNSTWDWLHRYASNFGYQQYSHEAWHWSPTGH